MYVVPNFVSCYLRQKYLRIHLSLKYCEICTESVIKWVNLPTFSHLSLKTSAKCPSETFIYLLNTHWKQYLKYLANLFSQI